MIEFFLGLENIVGFQGLLQFVGSGNVHGFRLRHADGGRHTQSAQIILLARRGVRVGIIVTLCRPHGDIDQLNIHLQAEIIASLHKYIYIVPVYVNAKQLIARITFPRDKTIKRMQIKLRTSAKLLLQVGKLGTRGKRSKHNLEEARTIESRHATPVLGSANSANREVVRCERRPMTSTRREEHGKRVLRKRKEARKRCHAEAAYRS